VLGQAAHLRITSDTLGDVALHLRIRDGQATVRLEADAPGALERRAPELARALAAEGLALARFEVERREAPQQAPARDPSGDAAARHSHDGGRGQADRRTPDDPPAPAPRRESGPRARRSAHDVTA
jgi:flagellar hook-length control protein FliK